MPPSPLRQEDYLAIEAAVMETARGRWFLSEYARRNRNADTDTLLGAIDKLEKSIMRERSPSALMDRVKMDLADMSSAIEKTKREIAQIKHEDNAGAERFERASMELDAIVTQTETATGDILSAAEKIQEFAWSLREGGASDEQCDALDMEATNIYMACSFQDLTGQRIRKIVDVMRYVESRINSMNDIWGFDTAEVEIDHSESRAHDTRPDAHLLNGPQLHGEGVEQDDVDHLLNHDGADHDSSQNDVDALFGSSDGADMDTSDPDVLDAEAPIDAADLDAMSFDSVDFDTVDFDVIEDDEAADPVEAEADAEAEDEAEIEAEADAVEEEAAEDLFDAVEADAEADQEVETEVAILEDEEQFVQMGDLDWMEDADSSDDADDEADPVEDSADAEMEAVAEDAFEADAEAEADVFATADMDEDLSEAAFEALSDEEKAAVELFDEASADVFATPAQDMAEDTAEEEAFDAFDADDDMADVRDRVAAFS